MTIQEAVKLATKHGYRYMGGKLKWDDNAGWFYIATDNGGMQVSCISDIMLDPKFWEALGKAEGWGSQLCNNEVCQDLHPMWVVNMHRMIDALIAGESLEEFFKEL